MLKTFFPFIFLFTALFTYLQSSPLDAHSSQWPPALTANDPSLENWDSFSQFIAEAEQLGLQVLTPQLWNWAHADIRIPIIILAPQDNELNPLPLLSFLKQGGRVLLADDFNAGAKLFQMFHIKPYRSRILRRDWDPLKDIDLHQTSAYMGKEADFLLRQAPFLLLNLPQWLRAPSQAIPLLHSSYYKSTLPDSRQGGLILLKLHFHQGRLIVMSDPSVFINQMLPYANNRRFAQNILRYLTAPLQARKIILLQGIFTWYGRPTRQPPPSRLLQITLWETLLKVNETFISYPSLYESYSMKLNLPKIKDISIKKSSYTTQRILQDKILFLYPYVEKISLFFIIFLGIIWIIYFTEYQKKESHYIELENDKKYNTLNFFEENIQIYLEEENFSLPLITLKRIFLWFLAEQLKMKHSSDDFPSDLAKELPRYLAQHLAENDETSLVVIQKIIDEFIYQIPHYEHYYQLNSLSIDKKTFIAYYQKALKCLDMLGLKEEFQRLAHHQLPYQA